MRTKKGKNMKRITYSIFVGSLALAVTALAAPNDNPKKARKGKATAQTVAPLRSGPSAKSRGAVTVNRSVPATRVQRDYARSNTVRSTARANAVVNRERNIQRAEVAASNRARVRENVAVSRETARANQIRARENVAVNRERAARFNRVGVAEVNRTRNVTVVNNWRSDRFSGPNYVAFRNYHRTYHDRGWWQRHHSNITFVLGGWWYWDAGYWYPAWGYAPSSYYPYDGPIYTGYEIGRAHV